MTDIVVKDGLLISHTIRAVTVAGIDYPVHIPADAAGNIVDLAVPVATLGATTGAKVVTDATGTIQQYLRGLVTFMANSLGAGTAAAAQRVTHASDDPAVATLGATTGAKVVTDATGTIQQYLRGLITFAANALGSGTMAAAGRFTLATDDLVLTGSKVGIRSRYFSAAATTLTRPANQTPYSPNDSISDNATAGSVTALSASPSDTNNDTICITEVILDTSDTALAAAISVRAYLFNSDPTASSGVVGGDNAAYSNKKAGFIGSLSGTFRAFSDGGKARLVPDEGSFIVCSPTTGAKTIYIQYQTLAAFTPSANSTTIDAKIKGFQGRA